MHISKIDLLIAERLKLKNKSGKITSISEIDDDINIFYNSVNIACGKQGQGKTLLFLREFINISMLDDPAFHLIIYINQSGEIDDETYKAVQDLITIPTFAISYENAEETINGLLDYKHEYYKFIDNPEIIKDWSEEKIKVISEALAIKLKDKNLPKTLHTIIFFEDAAFQTIFKKQDSYFNKLVTRCRHNNTIFLFAVQKLQAVSKPVLSQTTSTFIYPGYSPQELAYIHRMTANTINYQDLKAVYSTLKQYNLLSVNSLKQTIGIIDLSHISKLMTMKNNKKFLL